MSINDKLVEFLRDSVKLIDDIDIEREMSNTQIQFGKKLFNTDLEINAIECQTNRFIEKTNEIGKSIFQKRKAFNDIHNMLQKFD